LHIFPRIRCNTAAPSVAMREVMVRMCPFLHSFIHSFACQKSFTSSEEQDTDYCPLCISRVLQLVCKLWGSHGAEYEEYYLLGCQTMQTDRNLSKLWRKYSPSSMKKHKPKLLPNYMKSHPRKCYFPRNSLFNFYAIHCLRSNDKYCIWVLFMQWRLKNAHAVILPIYDTESWVVSTD
jgi:hypothetical protein